MVGPDFAERWAALVKFDDEISAAAMLLQPYGDEWIDEFGRAFFALNEERKYIGNIVKRLTAEAEHNLAEKSAEAMAKIEEQWKQVTRTTARGEPCTDESRNILAEAIRRGFTFYVEPNGTFVLSGSAGSSYLRSNAEIKRFAQLSKLIPPASEHGPE
jgi:hypothetical protein